MYNVIFINISYSWIFFILTVRLLLSSKLLAELTLLFKSNTVCDLKSKRLMLKINGNIMGSNWWWMMWCGFAGWGMEEGIYFPSSMVGASWHDFVPWHGHWSKLLSDWLRLLFKTQSKDKKNSLLRQKKQTIMTKLIPSIQFPRLCIIEKSS